MKAPSRADDERLLKMLWAADVDRLSFTEIAERFRCSKGSVAGAIGRVRREDAEAHGE